MKFNNKFRSPFSKERQPGTPLIANFERGLLVGMGKIDSLHREFVDMVNALEEADDKEFARLFDQLLAHTKGHFEFENSIMDETAYPERTEHQKEHVRVLNELAETKTQIDNGQTKLARSYVCERLPSWFRFHVMTMDQALASHLEE